MSDELIPQDSAQKIVNQAFIAIHAALENQVALSKQQLTRMMLAHLERAVQEYINITAKKLDEYTPKNG